MIGEEASQEIVLTTIINNDTVINLGAGGDTSSVVMLEDDFLISNPGGTVSGQEPPYVSVYGITLVNTEDDSCTVTATRASGGTTETVTLAKNDSVTLAKKISSGKAIETVYTSIVADYDGTTVEVDTTTVVTEDISIDLEKPAGE